MKLIDTHTHLYLPQFDEDREAAIARAKAEGIEQFYLPNIDTASVEPMLQMETDYPGVCYPMIGLHPCSVKADFKEALTQLKSWLKKHKFYAIGEIGIDLHWDTTFVKEQQEAFITQINWAKEHSLPIVIHSRKSTEMVIDIIREHKDERLFGIFHCFGGTAEQAQKITDLGFLLGIGGVLTFKKAGLDKTMEAVDLEHVVLETDSPYLAPVPFRGKRNESAYVRYVAERLAEVKGVPLAEIARITTQNAERVFGKEVIAS